MKRRWWILVAVVALALTTATLVVARSLSGPSTAGDPAGSTQPVPPHRHPVFAVKIDDVPEARPQTGLGAADVVYVEPVEGGLTRLIVVYFSAAPALAGPVRSARATDVQLLSQYGRPTLAYSGAAPEILPALHAASFVNASPQEVPDLYFRDPARPAPHNLYVHAARLPSDDVPPGEETPRYGPVPPAGVPASGYAIGYGAARFEFGWSASTARWTVSLDGSPVTSTESGAVTAATVVEQRVTVRYGEPGEYGTVSGSPIATTIGTGPATVLRDGLRFAASWTRATPDSPTRFHTTAGTPLPFAAGPLWILLVPA
ncbi:DUF3048 domain-containing protein [Amycolatopsis samaneae]|uniref:DUF3048 domain-containing protein n=1 Tax=Amycolatopsis samaneae TaxID=664691 RepID=A0ABW5GR84_9PSEU